MSHPRIAPGAWKVYLPAALTAAAGVHLVLVFTDEPKPWTFVVSLLLFSMANASLVTSALRIWAQRRVERSVQAEQARYRAEVAERKRRVGV